MISLHTFSTNTNLLKMAEDCCQFQFLRRNVDGKHLIRFQSENIEIKLRFQFFPAYCGRMVLLLEAQFFADVVLLMFHLIIYGNSHYIGKSSTPPPPTPGPPRYRIRDLNLTGIVIN